MDRINAECSTLNDDNKDSYDRIMKLGFGLSAFTRVYAAFGRWTPVSVRRSQISLGASVLMYWGLNAVSAKSADLLTYGEIALNVPFRC